MGQKRKEKKQEIEQPEENSCTMKGGKNGI